MKLYKLILSATKMYRCREI